MLPTDLTSAPTPLTSRPWALDPSIHHLPATAHRPPRCHLTAGHCPDKDQEGEDRQHSGPVEPGAPAASRAGPPRTTRGHYGRTIEQISHQTPLTDRGRPHVF